MILLHFFPFAIIELVIKITITFNFLEGYLAKEGYIVRLPNYIRKTRPILLLCLNGFLFVSAFFTIHTLHGLVSYFFLVGATAAAAAAKTLRMYVTKINPSLFACILLL